MDNHDSTKKEKGGKLTKLLAKLLLLLSRNKAWQELSTLLTANHARSFWGQRGTPPLGMRQIM